MSQAISEAASEKKRRGRPRMLSAFQETHLKHVMNNLTTDRSRQNFTYAGDAFNVLGVGPGGRPRQGYENLRWLADWDAVARGARGKVRWSILAELGRLTRVAPDDVVYQVADQICGEKPCTKDAVAFIRRVRLGRSAPTVDGALVDRLAGCLDAYWNAHPDISTDVVLEAISELHAAVQSAAEWRWQ
jgi:hypothetical protein